jgi:DNA polymerase-3 subunit epsilon
VVIVEDSNIVDRVYSLIRPPTRDFVFTHIHGLTWSDVKQAPAFADVWPEIRARLKGIEFFAAHNASFDRGVLSSCCDSFGVPGVRRRFVCTVDLARAVWNIYPTKLPDVCRRLRIPVRHHQADSDAEACARIVMAAAAAGWAP